METLESGTLFIKTRKLEETAEHISRLSIRLMLNGEQYYKVGNRDCLVTPQNFLVINQGQQYKTTFEGAQELEMLMVAFKPGMAADIHRTLTTSQTQLLDDPFAETQTLHFFEQTYALDPFIHQQFQYLRQLMDAPLPDRKTADLERVYTLLLERLIALQFDITHTIHQLPFQRPATREEAYRRLSMARDFMEAHYRQNLSIPQLAQVACLSPHHFKRLFKQAYHLTPHQFLIQKRLETARQLMATQTLAIQEVCQQVGFDDASSFIRLFKKHYHQTPGKYRTQLSATLHALTL